MKLLSRRVVAKPWGRDDLPREFRGESSDRIGEVWFEPPAELPDLLAKYIFTSEKLSVQVHPSDAQAKALKETGRGKEECWLVVDAEPGATLGIGFSAPSSSEIIRQSAIDGSIEELMEWFEVQPGDFFYIPAGTVHAIGAGITLVEIQQNSEITYRLFDYGRPRELHLERGIAVAKGEPHSPALRQNLMSRSTVKLVDGPYFGLLRVVGPVSRCEIAMPEGKSLLVLPIKGQARIDNSYCGKSEAAIIEAGDDFRLAPGSECLIAWSCLS